MYILPVAVIFLLCTEVRTLSAMEEVEGIPGKLPPLAPFPAHETRQTLPFVEWQACLDAWIFCVEFRLRLLPEHFHCFKLSQTASGVPFLLSYFLSWASPRKTVSNYRPTNGKEQKLHRHCLLLLRRLLLETDIPYDCSARELFFLLANASLTFISSPGWHDTLQQAWARQEKLIFSAVEQTKSSLVQMLAGGCTNTTEAAYHSIYQITALSKCLPQTGKIMMTGSDFVDSLTSTYHDLPVKLESAEDGDLKNHLIENLFMCLRSLMKNSNQSTSLLLDVLYSLKADAEAEAKINPNRPTLLSSLVCSTIFVRHLDTFLATASNARGDTLLRSLRSYQTKMSYLHPIAEGTRSWKGKGRAKAADSLQEMHIHKAAQVSQIHDLFPETPTLYILCLLDYFSDDIEAVTASLLEPESLPEELRDPQSYVDDAERQLKLQPDLVPCSTEPPDQSRRNIFDDDDFDRLRMSSSQVHFGRKEHDYGDPLSSSEKAKKKAAILAALTAFDSDDDERDDTYDVADVGGAVDNTVDTDARSRGKKFKDSEEADVNEQILFKAWRSNPELFTRDSKTRLSQPRQQLKSETEMTDEQIEGWALMLSRDDAAVLKLENKYGGMASLGGQQKALASTKWGASPSGTATEEETTDTDADGGAVPARGGASTRSRSSRDGLGHGRGKGSTSGPSADPGTQNARKRKEQGRGRGGANHSRREGRARKMGRGFGNLPVG